MKTYGYEDSIPWSGDTRLSHEMPQARLKMSDEPKKVAAVCRCGHRMISATWPLRWPCPTCGDLLEVES